MPEGKFESTPEPEPEKTDWSLVEKIIKEREEKRSEKTDWSRVEEIMRKRKAQEKGESIEPVSQLPEQNVAETESADRVAQVLESLKQKNQETIEAFNTRRQAIQEEAERLKKILLERPLTPEEKKHFNELTS